MSAGSGPLSCTWGRDDLLRRLPHAPPALLLESVECPAPGERGTARAHFPSDHPVFRGHFPGRPVVPAWALLEAAAQALGCVAFASEAAARTAVLAEVARARFLAPLGPDARVELDVQIEKRWGEWIRGRVEAREGGRRVAEMELTLSTGAV